MKNLINEWDIEVKNPYLLGNEDQVQYNLEV